jgi:hypothetical protein
MTTMFTPRTRKTEAGYLAIIDAYRFNDAGFLVEVVLYYAIGGQHRTRIAAMAKARLLKDKCESLAR